jgi:hypothetical protein
MNTPTREGREIMANTPITPKALATELAIDPKRLRAFLRSQYTRPAEAKNTSWTITDEAAKAAREHFAPKPVADEA